MRKGALALVAIALVAMVLYGLRDHLPGAQDSAADTNTASKALPGYDGWKSLPPVPPVTGAVRSRFLKDVAASRRAGNRSDVFAKVGDSNTAMPSALYGLGCLEPKLSSYGRLAPTIDRYNQVILPDARPMPGCSPATSFSRRSDAAVPGTNVAWTLKKVDKLPTTGNLSAPPDCQPQETLLACELRITRPRYVFIMTGTNDYFLDLAFHDKPGIFIARDTRKLVRSVRRRGSVPILSTLPPFLTSKVSEAAIENFNRSIAGVARQEKVPLINLWGALHRKSMVNFGMEDYGLHLRTLAGGLTPIETPGPTTLQDSIDFAPKGLRMGSNRRNLIWLETLARLDQVAGSR